MVAPLDPAFPDRNLATIVEQRILANYYRERIFLVVGLPKSASTAFTKALSQILPEPAKGKLAQPRDVIAQGGMNRSVPISLSVLLDEGLVGAWQNHAPYSHTSVELLRLLRIRYAILFRHPLDHLVALTCHWRKPNMIRVLQRYDLAGRDLANTALSRVSIASLKDSSSVEDTVRHLITRGYLVETLLWLSLWTANRSPGDSMLVRTEELNENPEYQFQVIAKWLNGRGSSGRSASHIYAEGRSPGVAGLDSNVYPKGWTGGAGAWRAYCGRETVNTYNSVVERFLAIGPPGQQLAEVIPDLFARF